MATDIASLGIAVDSSGVVRARDELGRFTGSAGAAEQSTGKLTKATDILSASVKALAEAYAAYKIADHVKEMALLAARYETMGVVMRVAGNNAGYTGAQMQELEKQLQKTGISMLQSRNALTQLATANIDLSKATQLARAAQDLAVVGNMNSSEALGNLVHGIKSGQVEVLHTLGLNVSFEASYKRMAMQLGTTTEKLSEHQKMVARTNIVLQEASKYQGIYEESMTTAGKALTSLTRYWEDLKVKAGDAFLPALSDAVFKLTDALKAANTELNKAGSSGLIDSIGQGLGKAFRVVYETVAILAANVAYVFTMIGNEIGGIAAQVAAVLHGDFKGALEIGKMMEKDAEAAKRALTAYEEKILGVTAANDASNQSAAETARLAHAVEQGRIAAGEASRKAAEAEERRLKAAEEAHKLQKKMDEQFKHTIKAIEEKTAAEQLDTLVQGKLTEGQKYAIKVLDDLRSGVLRLSEAQRIRLATELEAYLHAEKIRKAQDDDEKAQEALKEVLRQKVAVVYDSIEALEKELDLYGMDAEQIALYTASKLQAQLATAELSEEERNAIEAQIAGLEKLAKLQRRKGELDKQAEEQKKVAEEMAQVWKNFTENVQRNLGDGLYNFMQGKFDDIGSAFKSMIQRMVADALAARISQAMFGGAGGEAGLLGSLVSSGLSLLSGGPSVTVDTNGMGLSQIGSGQSLGSLGLGAGRASGGEVAPWSAHPVNEDGPELLSVGGRDVLMMGSKGGTVTPNDQLGKSVSINVNQTINIDSRSDAAQIRQDMYRLKEATKAEIMEKLNRGAI